MTLRSRRPEQGRTVSLTLSGGSEGSETGLGVLLQFRSWMEFLLDRVEGGHCPPMTSSLSPSLNGFRCLESVTFSVLGPSPEVWQSRHENVSRSSSTRTTGLYIRRTGVSPPTPSLSQRGTNRTDSGQNS